MAFGQFTSNPNLRQQLKSGTYKKDLIIPKGVLVVCKNAIVKFSSGHGIIVKQGGTLYIDHSIITHENDNLNNPYQRNTCGEYWKGIFVEGNPDSSQNIQYNKTCNLIEACVNLYNNGQDSAFGMNDCWNANSRSHIQGLVYMKNSRIRHAVIGISLGDIANNMSHQISPFGPKGGGLLIAKNCKFSNMHNSAISFAPYTKFINLSIIESDTFECSSEHILIGFNCMKGMISSFNSFSFPITKNYFFRSTSSKWEFRTGISFFDGVASINLNKFQNLTSAILLRGSSFSLKKSIECNGNIAIDCNQIFTIWSSDLARITNNKITVKNVGNIPINSWFAASGIFNCKYSVIQKNQIRPSDPNVVMNCIGITMGGFNSTSNLLRQPNINSCNYNTVIGLSNSFGHNEDSRGNLFDCNIFNSNISFTNSLFDIGHTTPYLPAFALSYGSKKNPLSNTFTPPALNSTLKNIWTNTLYYTYYFNPLITDYRPKTFSPGITKTQGQLKYNPCPDGINENFLIKDPCVKDKLPVDMNKIIPSTLYGRKNLDTVGNDTWDYFLAKSSFMELFQKNFNTISSYYSDTFKNDYISKIDTLLETIPDSSDFYYYSSFHYLLHNDSIRWNNLKSEINSKLSFFTELNYLTEYIEILKTLESNHFDSLYITNIKNSLDTIKESNSLIKQKAMSLYCYLYNQGCIDPMMNFKDSSILQIGDSISYSYSPNPFNSNLNLTLTNNYSSSKSIQIAITPFSSINTIFTNTLNIPAGNTITVNIVTNSWLTGHYALLLNYSGYFHSDILYKP